MRDLRAGAASVRITPPVGVDLAGYALREGPSEGVHDDLWCRALVLEASGERLALLGLDLLGVDFDLDAAIRKAGAAAAGVAPDHVVVNCSHTHAGPAVVVRFMGLGRANVAYVRALPGLVGEAVAEAAGRLAPAVLSYGTAPGRAGVNRRERTPEGGVKIGRNPQGLVDQTARALGVAAGGTATGAAVLHHACHGTSLGAGNRMISAEWMGAACRKMGEHLGPNTVPAFWQGCCGQINPDVREGSVEEMARVGTEMGQAALAALRGAEELREVCLGARLARIALPLEDPPAPEVARAGLDAARARAEAARTEGAHPYAVRAWDSQVAYAEMVLDLSEGGARGRELPFTVQAVRAGELALVGLSGEVFLEFAHQIESESPFPRTLVLGYSNGCVGYVPTAEAFEEGGYEAVDSFRWYGTLPLAPEAGEVMVAAASSLLRELRESSEVG